MLCGLYPNHLHLKTMDSSSFFFSLLILISNIFRYFQIFPESTPPPSFSPSIFSDSTPLPSFSPAQIGVWLFLFRKVACTRPLLSNISGWSDKRRRYVKCFFPKSRFSFKLAGSSPPELAKAQRQLYWFLFGNHPLKKNTRGMRPLPTLFTEMTSNLALC